MKVKMIKGALILGYGPAKVGTIHELKKEQADRVINAKLGVAVDDEKKPKKPKDDKK